MKRYLLAALSMLFFVSLGFSQQIKIDLGTKTQGYQVLSQSDYGFGLNLTIGELLAQKSETPAGVFYQLQAPSLIKVLGNGEPMLPAFSRLIRVPFGADVSVEVVRADYKIVNLKEYGIDRPLIPAQPSIRKSEDPNKHFVFDKEAYSKNSFKGNELVKYEELGIMRNIRYGRLQVTPFEYNPVTNELKVYTNIQVKVTFKHPDLALTAKMDRIYNIPGRVDNSVFLNTLPSIKSVGIPTNFPLTYVVIAPVAFKNNAKLVEFINWKKQQGYRVIEGYTGDNVGTSIDDIKNWLQNLYNNPPSGYNPPAYVLLIGDVSNMPAHQYSEITDSPYSDLYYVDFTNDYRPEIDFGRISAESATELENALTKVLHFERDQFTGDYSHLHEVLMVPGDDESHEDTWGNGQIWYGVNYYFNAAHNIYSHTFYQDPENNGVPGGNAAVHDSILTDISNGVSFANYTAHCSPDGWAEPSFSISDLSTLTNQNKYSVWIGNCCQSFKFDESDAFGEVALYIADKGAAAYIGGSQYTYWDEDYWWGVGVGEVVAQPQYDQTGRGVYDAMFHDQANEVNDPSVWALSVRQQIDAGNIAVDASNSNMKNYYWCIYQVSGDPSMITRVGTPANLTLNLEPMIVGNTEIKGTTLPYAFVAVTQDDNLIGVGMADGSGNLNITTLLPIPGGNLHVVAYGQNMTVYEEDIPAFVPNDPYLLVTEIDPDTVNYNSNVEFNLTIGNINNDYGADSVYVLASVSDPEITLTTDSLWIGAFGAGDTNVYNSAIAANIGLVPDLHRVTINFEIHGVRDTNNDNVVDTAYVWEGTKSFVVRAPKLEISDMHFVDPEANGYIDLGSNDTLVVTISNNGGADAGNVTVSLTCSNSEVILPSSVTVSVAAGASQTVELPIQVPDSATEGVKTWFNVTAAQDIYNDVDSISAWVGQPAEILIGDGTSTVKYPLYTYYKNEKTQILYKAEQLVGAHMISSIGFQIGQSGTNITLKNFTIKMKLTDLDQLPADAYVDMSDATIVLDTVDYNYVSTPAGEYVVFDLDRQFFYDGTSNLLVEVVWGDNGQYVSNYTLCYGTDVGYTSVDYGYSDYQTPPEFDYSSTLIPNTKMVFSPFVGSYVMVPLIYRDTVLHETDVQLPLIIRNYGNDTANNVTVTLKVYGDGVTVLDSVETIAQILPGETLTIDNAYTVHVGALANGTIIKLGFVSPQGEKDGYLVVKAPQLEFVDMGIDNELGYLPGGESGQYYIKIANVGMDIAPAVNLSMTGNQPNVFAIGSAPDPVDIAPGDTVTLYFPVSAADIDSSAKILLDIQAVTGNYTFETNTVAWVNMPYEQIIGEPLYYSYYYPFYQYWKNEKTQMLFYSSEFITTPVRINKFGVNVYSIEGNLEPLKNFTIKMFTTSDQAAPDNAYFTETTQPVQVYNVTTYTPVEGWNIFNLTNTYLYDGSNNLVVEIVWGKNDEYISDHINTLLTETEQNTVAYGYSDIETPPNFDYASKYRPVAFFGYAQNLASVEDMMSEISVSPNPTSGRFVISNAKGAKMTITDISGRTVMSGEIVSDRQNFDISNFTSGMYLIRLDSERGTAVFKLIKQ